jgi:hypothetical protein
MALERIAAHASDPSVDGGLLAWHEAGAAGVLVSGGGRARVGGTHPALGGHRLAVVAGGGIAVRQTSGPPFAVDVPAPGADAVAVSATWIAWRVREGDADAIYTAPLPRGPIRLLARAAQLGRPSLEGGRLAFHANGRIVLADLATGRLTTVRRERRALLLNPSLHGGRLLYVRSIYRRQELRLGPQTARRPRRDAKLWSTVPTGRRDAGYEPGKEHHRMGYPKKLWRRPRRGLSMTLWTTALAADAAYVTRLRQIVGQPLIAEIMRVPR